jgi:hypothetical protein
VCGDCAADVHLKYDMKASRYEEKLKCDKCEHPDEQLTKYALMKLPVLA